MREGTAYRYLQVSPIAGALGAEVQGVDLARPLAPEVVREVRKSGRTFDARLKLDQSEVRFDFGS